MVCSALEEEPSSPGPIVLFSGTFFCTYDVRVYTSRKPWCGTAPRAGGEVAPPAGGPGGPPEVLRRAAEGRFLIKYMRIKALNVRLTRSAYPLVDVVPAGLELYAICKESSTK